MGIPSPFNKSSTNKNQELINMFTTTNSANNNVDSQLRCSTYLRDDFEFFCCDSNYTLLDFLKQHFLYAAVQDIVSKSDESESCQMAVEKVK